MISGILATVLLWALLLVGAAGPVIAFFTDNLSKVAPGVWIVGVMSCVLIALEIRRFTKRD